MGIAIAALSAVITVYALSRLYHYRREARRLSEALGRFLSGEDMSAVFSVKDDAFAPLENAVVELETRLLNERAQRSQQNKKSGDLMLELSHQLKTPLASLRLYAEMDAGAHISEQTVLIDRMEGLIYSLLRLERLRSGGIAFDFQVHQLFDIAKEVAESFRPLYPNKKILIEGGASLRCDGDRLSEALVNLIKNACEHTQENGKINIVISRSEAAVFIVLEDDGGGVPDKDLPRLFERFFRSTRSQAHEGSGVGLSIIKEIVRMHHGSIEAQNTGKGLRFTICIPDLRHNLKLS